MRPVAEMRDALRGIEALQYSPDNRSLAAGSSDMFIDVYSVPSYHRVISCLT